MMTRLRCHLLCAKALTGVNAKTIKANIAARFITEEFNLFIVPPKDLLQGGYEESAIFRFNYIEAC